MRRAAVLALLLAPLPFVAAPPLAAQDETAPAEPPALAKPAALTAEAMPPIPLALAEDARPYLEARGAGFAGFAAWLHLTPADPDVLARIKKKYEED